MKTWTTQDFFDRTSGSTHWPSSDPNDTPIDTFTCRRCGYTFDMMMYGSFRVGDTSPKEHAEQKMLAHIAMFHRDGLGREPLAYAEGKPDVGTMTAEQIKSIFGFLRPLMEKAPLGDEKNIRAAFSTCNDIFDILLDEIVRLRKEQGPT